MAINAMARAKLSRLRQDIAEIEGRLAEEDRLALDSPDGEPAGLIVRASADLQAGGGRRVRLPLASPRLMPRSAAACRLRRFMNPRARKP